MNKKGKLVPKADPEVSIPFEWTYTDGMYFDGRINKKGKLVLKADPEVSIPFEWTYTDGMYFDGRIPGESDGVFHTFRANEWNFVEEALPPHERVLAMKPGTVFTSSGGGDSIHIRLTQDMVWIDGEGEYVIYPGLWAPESTFTIKEV